MPLDHDYTIVVFKEGNELGGEHVGFTASTTSAIVRVGVYNIVVFVKGAAGQPIRGAFVELIRGGVTVAGAETDAGGAAFFTKLPGADYEVRVTYGQLLSRASLPKGTRRTTVTLDIKPPEGWGRTAERAETPAERAIAGSATQESLIIGIVVGVMLGLAVALVVVRASRRRRPRRTPIKKRSRS